jgi:hypothetical protein
MDAAETLRSVGLKMNTLLREFTGEGLSAEWGAEATRQYRQRYAEKRNPYGEVWPYRPGDEKRKVSSWKFGKVSDLGDDGFTLIVARPNGKRSCVPFEPRGLGIWRAPFDRIATERFRTFVARYL